MMGMSLTSLGYLGRRRHIDYPQCWEHDGHFIGRLCGDAKQKIEVVKVKITDLAMNCKN